MRNTKIICTLGPAVDSDQMVEELIKAGMNCARMNFSHGTHEEQKVRIDRVKRIREKLNANVAILLDTKGPEIRVKDFKDGKVVLEPGKEFVLSSGDFLGDATKVATTYPDLAKYVTLGSEILIDDGHIVLSVTGIDGNDVKCIVVIGGKVSNHKGVNIPNVTIPMPYLSEVDKNDILFGIENDIDFVAASFTRTAWDIIDLREFLNSNGGDKIKIIAKIENASGIDSLDEIIKYADGVMIARGDMGVEMDYTVIPGIQKQMIRKCYKKGVPVVTATQMLESMTASPIPTRAEVSDVANAVYSGTTIVMLSGETAAGDYPIEAVKAMSDIVTAAEKESSYKPVIPFEKLELEKDIATTISLAACDAARYIDASAILVVTRSGRTAHLIADFHPNCPIIAAVTKEKAARQLALARGVSAYVVEDQASAESLFEYALEVARQNGEISPGDTVVIVAGGSVVKRAPSDMLKITTI
ncbi:MAG: pyruvate kinase [Parasporobacterium sp.]|nr:pyruvate kinase [Parasporobacterium sp.]